MSYSMNNYIVLSMGHVERNLLSLLGICFIPYRLQIEIWFETRLKFNFVGRVYFKENYCVSLQPKLFKQVNFFVDCWPNPSLHAIFDCLKLVLHFITFYKKSTFKIANFIKDFG